VGQANDFFFFDHHRSDDGMLQLLMRECFEYFLTEINPTTGLIADSTQPGSPCSIAVVGMAISTYIIGVEEKLLSRREAVNRILKIFRFFINSEQSTAKDASGYKGFYYHFLDMDTGKRTWNSELSTIDTSFFIAGVLSAVEYFTGTAPDEKEIKSIGEQLYRRIDWTWALNGGTTLTHGWKPESGFSRYRWDNQYSEALLLYILALGSPTHAIGAHGYRQWTATFTLEKMYSFRYIYAGPLFIHQFSHLWIDFKGIQDDCNRNAGFDYFENSRRATLVHRQYAIQNPLKYEHYGAYCWGLTAGVGPGRKNTTVSGIRRSFYGYKARGVPFGPDDGTVTPWAAVASLPFAPEIVLETLRHTVDEFKMKKHHPYGFHGSYNPIYPNKKGVSRGWASPWKFGLNLGPITMMIGNYQKAMVWRLMKKCNSITAGLKCAGFTDGYLFDNGSTNKT
jgi:hypothetical protein